jgi:endonuclease/exonuclease/phosphatase family metal-dependent hydrolase
MTRSARHLLVAAAILGAGLAACGGDDGDSTGPADTTAVDGSATTSAPAPTAAATTAAATTEVPAPTEPAAPASLTVVTYNAGLARGFVDLAEERVPLVVDAVASLDADLVAVQEVWDPADVDALVAGVADEFPEQVFLEPSPEVAEAAACPGTELDALESCARTKCAGVPADQLADCVLTNCGAEYGACSPTCQTCLAANIGGTLDDVVSTCRTASERYAYGGAFGIGLLSRHPVLSSEEIVLDSSLNRRAVIYAVVDVAGVGPVHVFATHLSAVFADIPYPGEGTWEGEQRAQIERMLALIDERVPDGEPVVLLGDLNTGPAVPGDPGIAAEVPDNFALLPAAGLDAPYLDASPPEPRCTFCADNPLVGGADDDFSVLIDHVLTRGLEASAARRVLDEPVTVGTAESRLSDHYGVEVSLTLA